MILCDKSETALGFYSLGSHHQLLALLIMDSFSWFPRYCVSSFSSSSRDFFSCLCPTYRVHWIPALGPAPLVLPTLSLVSLPLSRPPSPQQSQDSFPESSTLSLSWGTGLAGLPVISIIGFHDLPQTWRIFLTAVFMTVPGYPAAQCNVGSWPFPNLFTDGA